MKAWKYLRESCYHRIECSVNLILHVDGENERKRE